MIDLNKMPVSLEAESSVLGSILIDSACIYKVTDVLKVSDFMNNKHQILYKSMLQLINEGKEIDVIILTDYLKSIGKYDEAGGKEYLLKLVESVVLSSNITEYATIIKNKSLYRNLIVLCDTISDKCYSEEKNVTQFASEKLFDLISHYSPETIVKLSDILQSNYALLSQMVNSTKKFKGLSTGFVKLDEMLSGLLPGNLYFVAGRPAMGKTSFAINIAQNVAVKSRKNVLIFSLEMSKEELSNRIASSEALIPSNHIRSCNITEDELSSFIEIIGPYSKVPIYIDDTADLSMIQITSKAKRLKALKGIDLIVIDYLQLISCSNSNNRLNEITNITRNLKILAKELNIPVICISQLSRACESRADNRPVLSDLRESGSIEQDADVVIFLYREEYYKPNLPDNKNMCDIIVSKHRAGSTGTVQVGFLGSYTSFYNL